MHIKDLYKKGQLGVSFELFPPKDPAGDEALYRAAERLVRHDPVFFSCTYGAGGTTRDRTIDICVEIRRKFNIPATAHFTCIGSSKSELLGWLARAKAAGIQNIMTLRGDVPPDSPLRADGLKHANELVALIKENYPEFGIGVAGYPEKHVEAKDAQTDLHYLKQKVDAGADAVYTQLFFENKNFFRFYEKYQKAGIRVPLIPGIMPITEFARIKRMAEMCGAHVPADLCNKLEAAKDDKEAQLKLGVEHAAKQCEELIANGFPGIHFYALNLSKACREVLKTLGR